jgi:hypothetical protein
MDKRPILQHGSGYALLQIVIVAIYSVKLSIAMRATGSVE